MTNKERILNGEKFQIPSDASTPWHIHFDDDGAPSAICVTFGSGHCNIEKFGRDRMKVYTFFFGKKLTKWIYFEDLSFPELTENGLFFKKD